MKKIIKKVNKQEEENKYEFVLLTLHLLFSKSVKNDIDYSSINTEYLEFLNKIIIESNNRSEKYNVDKFIFPETVFSNIEFIIDYFENLVPIYEKELDKYIESYPEMYEKYLGMINSIKKCCPNIRENIKKTKDIKNNSKTKNNSIYEIEFNKRYTELKDFSSTFQGVSKEHLEASIHSDYPLFMAIINNESLVKFKNSELYLESLNKILHDYPSLFFNRKIKKNVLKLLKSNLESENEIVLNRTRTLVSKIESLKEDYTNLPFDINVFKRTFNYLAAKSLANNPNSDIEAFLKNNELEVMQEIKKLDKALSLDNNLNLCYEEVISKYDLLELVKVIPKIIIEDFSIPVPSNIHYFSDDSYKEDIKDSIVYDFELIKALASTKEEYNETLASTFFKSDYLIYTLKTIIRNYPFLLKDLQISTRLIEAIGVSENEQAKKYIKEIETYSKKSNC